MAKDIVVRIKGDVAELKSALAKAGAEMEGFAKKGAGVGAQMGGAFAVLGASAAAVGVTVAAASIKAADDFERAHQQLVTAVKDSGHNFDQYGGKVKALDKNFEHFGFNSQQTEEALSHLVTAVQDPAKALGEMGLAANIAKARNISLTDATDLVAKAMAGNLRGLKQMGIDLPIVASNSLKVEQAQKKVADAQAKVNELEANSTKTKDAQQRALMAQERATLNVRSAEEQLNTARQHGKSPQEIATLQDRLRLSQQQLALASQQAVGPDQALASARANLAKAQADLNAKASAAPQILDALNQRFGGQAAAQADTYAGKVAAIKAQIHDLSVKIGQELEPALAKALDFLANHFIPGLQKAGTAVGRAISDVLQWGKDLANLGSGADSTLQANAKAHPGDYLHPFGLTPADIATEKMTAGGGSAGGRLIPGSGAAMRAGLPAGATRPKNYAPGSYQAFDPMALALLGHGDMLGRVTALNNQGQTVIVNNVTVPPGTDAKHLAQVLAAELSWASHSLVTAP